LGSWNKLREVNHEPGSECPQRRGTPYSAQEYLVLKFVSPSKEPVTAITGLPEFPLRYTDPFALLVAQLAYAVLAHG
jgi:hypothetical protein